MAKEWQQSVIDPVEALIGQWEERRQADAIATLLPAWRANAGLTDGWQEVLAAIGSVRRQVTLPDDEAAMLAAVASRIESTLRDR